MLLLFVVANGACGGGGPTTESVDRGELVSIVVDYPLSGSLTDAAKVTVRGRVSTLPDDSVLRVDGVVVRVDGFGEWRTSVALVSGQNLIEAVVRVRSVVAGNASVTLGRTGALSADVTGLVVEPGGAAAWVLDRAARVLLRVDLANGRSTEVSGPVRGTGAPLRRPFGLVLDVDAQVAWVRDEPNSIVSIDLLNGDRRPVSNHVPWFGAKPSGNELARGGSQDALLAMVLPEQGPNPSLVSLVPGGVTDGSLLPTLRSRGPALGDTGLGSGPSFVCPCAIGIAPSVGSSVLATRPDVQGLDWLSVDTLTGDRAVLARPTGSLAAAALDGSTSIAPLDADRWLVADPVGGQLHLLNLATHDSVSIANTGEAWRPSRIAWDPLSATAVAVDRLTDRLFVIDVAASTRRVVSTASVGSGPRFVRPLSISPFQGTEVLVGDGGLNALLVVDRATGDRRVLSGPGVGAGPAIDEPICVSAANAQGGVLVVDAGTDQLLVVDRSTGDREVALAIEGVRGAAADVFTGEAFVATRDRVLRVRLESPAVLETIVDGAGALVDVRAIRLDLAHRALVCLDTETLPDSMVRSRVVEVDLDTGVTQVLAVDFRSRPRSADRVQPADLIRFGSERTLLVADSAAGRLVLVDRESATITDVVSASAEPGPAFVAPAGIAFDGSVPVVFAVDVDRAAVITLDPLSGERLIISR